MMQLLDPVALTPVSDRSCRHMQPQPQFSGATVSMTLLSGINCARIQWNT